MSTSRTIAEALVREAVQKIREHDSAMVNAIIRGASRPTDREVAHHQQRIVQLSEPFIDALVHSTKYAKIKAIIGTAPPTSPGSPMAVVEWIETLNRIQEVIDGE